MRLCHIVLLAALVSCGHHNRPPSSTSPEVEQVSNDQRCSVPPVAHIPPSERVVFSCSCPDSPPSDNYEAIFGPGKHLARICGDAGCDPRVICTTYESMLPARHRTGCRPIGKPVPLEQVDDWVRGACMGIFK
jgi:hypothetical protein